MLVIGLGNPLKRDDDIGNIIANRLVGFNAVSAETTPESFISEMKKHNVVVFVDAVEFGGQPGDVKFFRLIDLKEMPLSTHSIPIETLREIMPRKKMFVIGVQPEDVDYGAGLTDELKKELDGIIEKTKELLNEIGA
ncbi:hydrogenase maturation protease [Candidatus Micrarchaeota archaeon]|nr:hydrogenase maturation protease [Candidatus Micrarchaeota archaeon]